MMQASSAKDRLQFIDAIRAYAILMMLQGHFVDTMLAYRFRDLENTLYSTWFFMRGMTAPIFFTVTGLVFTFLLLRDGRPIKENERIRKGIRRGFFLIFLGYLLKVNFPAFLIGWFYKSYPALDVLHNIGFALLALIGLYCLHLVSKISLPLLYFGGGIFIFLINPTWIAYEWDFLPIVLRNYFDADNGSIFLPVPWLGFTLLGAGLGWHLFHKTYLYRTWYWPAILLISGLTIHFFSTKGLLLLNQWTGWENFLQLAYDNVLFWRFGHVLIIISLFIFLEKIITFPPLMLKIGSETLTIYATHYVVLYGTWLGIGIKTFGQFTWHPVPVIIGAILFVLAAIIYIKYIEEIRTKLALHLPGRLRYLRRYIYIMGKRLFKQVIDQFRQWINLLSTNAGIW
ncbi:hypothetical protein LBMAG24_12950 [Bacteroidota bacterium]|nr:hypothetical protein LBMAG24_12950 [Bacteroidota bacterium]